MKSKILQEFLNSDVKIKSLEKLNEYIDYCIVNNQQEKLKFKSEHHHILPEELFKEFSNIKNNSWNGSHLVHKDHYTAHSLLAEALDNFSMTAAWWAMNNLNQKSGKIEKPEEIIGYERFAALRERAHKYIGECTSIHMHKKFIKNGTITTNAKEVGKNIKKYLDTKITLDDGTVTTQAKIDGMKHSKTLLKADIDGVSISEKISIKRQETMKKEILHEGNITTREKLKAIKRKETINNIFLKNGTPTTIHKEGIKLRELNNNFKEEKYNLVHKDLGIIIENIPKSMINKLSVALRKRIDGYLGFNEQSIRNLKSNNKLYLKDIGIIEVPNSKNSIFSSIALIEIVKQLSNIII